MGGEQLRDRVVQLVRGDVHDVVERAADDAVAANEVDDLVVHNVEVHVLGVSQRVGLYGDGVGPITIALLDNGVSPDLTAGDFIFSGSVPVQAILDRNTPERVNRAYMGQVQALVGATASGPSINTFIPVMPAEARSIPVTSLSATARSTPWLLNMRDDAFLNDFNIQRAVTAAYALVPDAFEFVHIVYGPQNHVKNRGHGIIRNSIQGIGLPVINTSANFGNTNKLLGYTVFPSLSFYDMQGPGVLHETGHQWINSLPGIFNDTGGGAHWPIGTMTNNVMGWSLTGGAGGNLGCALTSNGASISTLSQASQIGAYNSFELYSMGLVPSIDSGFVVTDQTAMRNLIAGNLNWCNGTTYNLATTSFSQSSLVSSAGTRVPSSTNSPRTFRVLTLVVSSGRTLGDDELRYISFMSARAQSPGLRPWAEGLSGATGPTFYEATGERASLDFRLDGTFTHGFEGSQ